MELNTQAQQREAVVQGRSLPPIPASVWHADNTDQKEIRRSENKILSANLHLKFVSSACYTEMPAGKILCGFA
ncbi:MAG: hypothetical protein LBJ00_09760 [Planctomycetaceae bacterium]|nr:hypothetical protein [Planctomycetaceae bacterium]